MEESHNTVLIGFFKAFCNPKIIYIYYIYVKYKIILYM